MKWNEDTSPALEKSPQEFDDYSKVKIKRLKRRNKSLILGIFGVVGALIVVVVLVVVLRPSECKMVEKLPDKEAYTVSKPEDLKIGLLFASKGARSTKEYSLKEATLMAIKDITTSQNGPGITTFSEDTESSPKIALRSFKRLYNEENVKLFVGLSNSEVVEVAAWAEKNANDTLILTPHATTTVISKYSNVIQLTMTNEALAYVLHSQLTEAKVSELIPIVQDDPYSLEIIDELNTIADSLMNNLKVNAPIKYSSGSLEKTVDTVMAQVKTALSARPNASIFLVGENEAKLLLEAAQGDSVLLGRMWYASDALALNDAILNSSKALSTSQIVSLYSLVYAGDQFGKSKKRARTFAKLSELLGEPPALQAAMAYDAIQVLYNTARATNSVDANQIKSELKSKEDWGSGLSGHITIDASGQRMSGEYLRVVVCPKIPNDKMAQLMMEGQWFIAGTTRVAKTNFKAKYGKRSANDEVMSKVLSMTSSNSLAMSSGAVVNRSALFKLEGYLNNTCSDPSIRVETIDPFSFRKVVKDFTKATFPNILVLPAVYGYQMRMTCEIPTGQLTYDLACPPSESPQEDKTCVGMLTKPKGRRKLLHNRDINAATGSCAGTSVMCGFCVVLSFSLCAAPCVVAVGSYCGASLAMSAAELDHDDSVICTELLEQGQLPLDVYLIDVSFGKRLRRENAEVFIGYHALAKPIVWLMQRSELITNIVKIFALPWAEEMSYREGEDTQSNKLGSLVMEVGVPLCTAVGFMVETWGTVVASIPWGVSYLGLLMIFGIVFTQAPKSSKNN